MNLKFVALGEPAPQGSMKGERRRRRDGSEVIALKCDNEKTMPWRANVASYAFYAMRHAGESLTEAPVEVIARFYFQRPKRLPKRVVHKTSAPDVDKLQRSIGDALTGVAIRDDAQIVKWDALKLFGTPERAEIIVRTVERSFEI